jgi:hypothetical protein
MFCRCFAASREGYFYGRTGRPLSWRLNPPLKLLRRKGVEHDVYIHHNLSLDLFVFQGLHENHVFQAYPNME